MEDVDGDSSPAHRGRWGVSFEYSAFPAGGRTTDTRRMSEMWNHRFAIENRPEDSSIRKLHETDFIQLFAAGCPLRDEATIGEGWLNCPRPGKKSIGDLQQVLSGRSKPCAIRGHSTGPLVAHYPGFAHHRQASFKSDAYSPPHPTHVQAVLRMLVSAGWNACLHTPLPVRVTHRRVPYQCQHAYNYYATLEDRAYVGTDPETYIVLSQERPTHAIDVQTQALTYNRDGTDHATGRLQRL